MENRISKRIEWIDIAKAIGIYLMRFNHNNDMPCKHIQFVIASFPSLCFVTYTKLVLVSLRF